MRRPLRFVPVVWLTVLLGALLLAVPPASAGTISGTVTTISSALNFPASSLSTSPDGTELFVTDQYAQEIFELDQTDGALTPFASAPGIEGGRLVIDSSDNVVYAADKDSQWLVEVVAQAPCSSDCPYGLSVMVPGDTYTVIGGGQSIDPRPNGVPATSLDFSADPIGTDGAGDLFFVGSAPNSDVYMLAGRTCASACEFGIDTVAGDVYWIAGNDYTGGAGDGTAGNGGPATAALLDDPSAAVTDPEGDLILADPGEDAVRIIAAADCTTCAFGLHNLTAGDIYALAGSGKDAGTLPVEVGAYAPTSVVLYFANTLGFDARGDLLIGSSASPVLNLVAASACTSSCPYGLASMEQDGLYPIEGIDGPPSLPTPNETLRASLVALQSIDGASIDHVGSEFLASGPSVLRVEPTTRSVVTPEKPRGDPKLIDHGKKLALTLSCTAVAVSCSGNVELFEQAKVTTTRNGKVSPTTEYNSVGTSHFSIRSRHAKTLDIALEPVGVRLFEKGRSTVVALIIDSGKASSAATLHVEREKQRKVSQSRRTDLAGQPLRHLPSKRSNALLMR